MTDENERIRLIHDGDHGGDDFITTLMFLMHPERFDLLGVTTCFGNVPVDLATKNALRALEMGGRPEIPVARGADKPFRSEPRKTDNAHGENGLGGVRLPEPSARPVEGGNALEWMTKTLEETTDPVTFCVTGPATNMAKLLLLIETRMHHLRDRIERIVVMGGGLGIGGNIKPFAEFNFYMDPEAADFVLKSEYEVVLHTLDTTHSLLFHPERQKRLAALPNHGETLCRIMRAAEFLDFSNFGANGAFMHDENTALYLLAPELYETEDKPLRVKDVSTMEPGRLYEDGNETVKLVTALKDDEAAFGKVFEALARLCG